MQRSVFKSTLVLLLKRSFHLESSTSVPAKSNCLDLLGRLLQGRLSLLGGRPLPFRFLPLFKGDNCSLYFNADEDEEFRRRLAMQLKELREALQETQELRERQEDELQEELQEQQQEEEYNPYTTRSREISAEDLSEEELNEMRELRMSAAGQDGRDQEEGSTTSSSEQPETSELEGEETTAEAREPQDPQEFDVQEVREGDIEGVYWTGEGKRIVTQTPQRKTGHSGFIDGEGEEIPLEELPHHHREDPSSAPPAPRAQAKPASDSDE